MKKHLLQVMGALLFTATMAGPLLATETAEQCLERVIRDCDAALADARWYEQVPLGLLCTALIAKCGIDSINVTIKLT